MCGICGLLDLHGRPADPRTLGAMARALAHRGPDGEGVLARGAAGLGHRRLAILDPTPAGAQPMRRDGLAITYNGEIYNFRELRAELEALGHVFCTGTDTEVALVAYRQFGSDCVRRFNGMFALAILDEESGALFLARDRYGIKPLYYAVFDGIFLFGSEQKAILVHPAARRDLDLEAMLEYFTFQNILTDRTFYQGIRLFPAGCHASVSPHGDGAPTISRFWDFDFQEPERVASEGEYLEELDRLFRQAVERQLVSDVELGTYLSGGIDSGSITAVAASKIPYVKSFTLGFDPHSAIGLGLNYDERAKAETMSYNFRTEHYEVVLKSGDMERCLPSLAWHLEEPRVGQSYPNYYIAKLASRFVKVALGGTGGDELFGGYPWRYYRAAVCRDFEDYIDKYYLFWQRLLPNQEVKAVFAPVWSKVRHVWTRDIFRDVFGSRKHLPCTPEQAINNSLYFEAKTFLHGLLLVKDKLSMAHGLESRVPFLDNDLVDFAMRLPVRHKLGNLGEVVRINENQTGSKPEQYYQKTRDGKLLLRKSLSRYVPDDIAFGVKQGFCAPDASWFKQESIRYVTRILIKGKPALYRLLNPEPLRRLVMEHLEGKTNRRLLIWSLLNVEEWLQAFEVGQVPPS